MYLTLDMGCQCLTPNSDKYHKKEGEQLLTRIDIIQFQMTNSNYLKYVHCLLLNMLNILKVCVHRKTHQASSNFVPIVCFASNLPLILVPNHGQCRLGVWHYERLAVLSSIINRIYIDPEAVATEYLCRCHHQYLRRCRQNKQWKTSDDEELLNC